MRLSGALHSQSEINIFKAVDISFVKTALAQKQTAGNQKRSAGQRPEKTLAGCQLMRHRQALINMSGNAFRPERDAQMLHGLIRVHQQRASRAEPGGKGKLRQQGRQPSRQNERIVIEEKKKIRPGRSGSGIACRGKIPVFLEPDTPEMPAEKPLTERFKVLCRLIGGAVVHNHDFQPRRAVFRQADQALPGQFPVIEHGDYNGNSAAHARRPPQNLFENLRFLF